MRRRVAVQADQFRLVVVSEELDSGRIHEGEVAVLVDDVEAVCGLPGDAQQSFVTDGRRLSGSRAGRQGRSQVVQRPVT